MIAMMMVTLMMKIKDVEWESVLDPNHSSSTNLQFGNLCWQNSCTPHPIALPNRPCPRDPWETIKMLGGTLIPSFLWMGCWMKSQGIVAVAAATFVFPSPKSHPKHDWLVSKVPRADNAMRLFLNECSFPQLTPPSPAADSHFPQNFLCWSLLY